MKLNKLEKKQMSNLNMNPNFYEELDDEKELEAIVGGAASFLRGDISASLVPEAKFAQFQGGIQGPTDLVAQSSTTLECWHECTVAISSC